MEEFFEGDLSKNITKEELKAFTKATVDSTVVLEKISNTLEQFSSQQKEILSRLQNGISKEIVNNIINELDLGDVFYKEKIKTLGKDLEFVKEKVNNISILIRTIGLVILVAAVILKFIGA